MERPSSGPRSLFPKGPSFTLEDFSRKDFVVEDFMNDLTESAIPSSRKSGTTSTTFDPKPLIRTFENALSQLNSLNDELQGKESELLSQVRRAEVQHDQTLETLGRKLDQSMSSFEALDLSLDTNNDSTAAANENSDGVGTLAIQIGEKLEEFERKRSRAQDAAFLVECWTELTESGRLTALEDIRRQGGAENKIRCAVVARQLTTISQQLDPTRWGQTNGTRGRSKDAEASTPATSFNTREILEKFCETLEQDLLKQFNNSYRRQNFEDMMECSKVLFDFNGGASVIAVFVNQHQFFIDRDQLMSDEVTADGEVWDALADPDSDPPGVEPSLQSLVDEVKIVMQEESFIIKRAFPYYELVLTKFIQRVFQQSVQQRLEKVLDKAETISSLAFLRSLHSSRTYLGSLVEDLKAHGLTEHPDACSAQISQVLDQQLDDLFIPYLMGSAYIESEKKSLEEVYSPLLFRFTIYHSRRKKTPTGFMASLAQQGTQLIASAKDAYLERLHSSDLTPTQKKIMLRVAGLKEKDDNDEIEVSEEDGALSVTNAKRMLKWLAESVQRALELGSQTETPKDMSVLLSLLLENMGNVYIETSLDAAHMQASILENAKTEPDLSYLTTLRPAVTVSAIMDRFIDSVLIRLAEANMTVRKNMESQRRTAAESIEKKTNNILKITIDVIANWTTKCLSGQKKQDFRPKDAELESLQTPTCLTICTFWGRAGAQGVKALDGQNSEKFFSELALTLIHNLFDHFKQFQVNATGGLMVTQDIAKYVSTVRDWPLNKDMMTTLELLTEVGSLFIVGPEALREKSRALASGQAGPRGKLTKVEFRAFVQRRDDVGSVGIQSVLASL